MTSYTYNMNVYFGKERQNATHATVSSQTRKAEWASHKIYMSNLFSLETSDDRHTNGYQLL